MRTIGFRQECTIDNAVFTLTHNIVTALNARRQTADILCN